MSAAQMSDATQNLIAKVLGLPTSLNKYWDIIDYYPNEDEPELVLAHYNDEFDPHNRMHEPLRSVRGTIVDLKAGVIVADSYGYTESLPCHSPISSVVSNDNPQGSFSFETDLYTYNMKKEDAPEEVPKISIGARTFDQSKTKLFIGYEGALIRIFKWKNTVFFSTHRRISAIRSSWGGRTPFLKLYEQLDGPPLDSFFGEEAYSPYCYMFLIADNDIRLSTSTSDNRLVFIGFKQIWEPGTFPGPSSYEVKFPTVGVQQSTFSTSRNSGLLIQPSISVDIANKFMFPSKFASRIPEGVEAKENQLFIEYNEDGTQVKDIYFNYPEEPVKDERVSGGDFIILYTESPTGETFVYRLEPLAYKYRADVTSNNPNLYNRFVTEMVNFVKSEPKDTNSYIRKFPAFKLKDLDIFSLKGRQVYWWSIFYNAVPPSYKDEVNGFFSRYEKDINRIANYILTGFASAGPEEQKRINDQTKKRFEDLYRMTTQFSGRNRGPYAVLKNFLHNETSGSLYRMITTIQNIEKLKKKEAEQLISVDSVKVNVEEKSLDNKL